MIEVFMWLQDIFHSDELHPCDVLDVLSSLFKLDVELCWLPNKILLVPTCFKLRFKVSIEKLPPLIIFENSLLIPERT